jgi:hypothetical protein
MVLSDKTGEKCIKLLLIHVRFWHVLSDKTFIGYKGVLRTEKKKKK